MSHSHSSLLELPLFSHPTLFISLLLPSRGNHQPPDPRTAGRFGRWTIQSPLTGYEPNAIVEISSTKRRISFWSEDNSGEDVTSTPVSSEVHERRSIGRLTSPLLMQKREASAVPPRIYHFFWGKNYVKLISHSKHGETCCDKLTQTEIEQRPKKCTGDTYHR